RTRSVPFTAPTWTPAPISSRPTRSMPRALPCQILHVVIGHGNARGIERVGLDDIGAGVQVGAVNGTDRVRLGNRQQIVVAFQVTMPVGKTLAAVGRLVEAMLLDHGAHGAIEN